MPAKGCFKCRNNDSGTFKNRKFTCILHPSCGYSVHVRKREAEDFWRVTALSNTQHTANLNYGSQANFDVGKDLPPVFKYMIYQVLLSGPTVKEADAMITTIRHVLLRGNGFPLIQDKNDALQKFNQFRRNKIDKQGTGSFNKIVKSWINKYRVALGYDPKPLNLKTAADVRAHVTENLLITTAEEYDALEDDANFAVLIEDSASLSNAAIPTFVVTSKYLAEWMVREISQRQWTSVMGDARYNLAKSPSKVACCMFALVGTYRTRKSMTVITDMKKLNERARNENEPASGTRSKHRDPNPEYATHATTFMLMIAETERSESYDIGFKAMAKIMEWKEEDANALMSKIRFVQGDNGTGIQKAYRTFAGIHLNLNGGDDGTTPSIRGTLCWPHLYAIKKGIFKGYNPTDFTDDWYNRIRRDMFFASQCESKPQFDTMVRKMLNEWRTEGGQPESDFADKIENDYSDFGVTQNSTWMDIFDFNTQQCWWLRASGIPGVPTCQNAMEACMAILQRLIPKNRCSMSSAMQMIPVVLNELTKYARDNPQYRDIGNVPVPDSREPPFYDQIGMRYAPAGAETSDVCQVIRMDTCTIQQWTVLAEHLDSNRSVCLDYYPEDLDRLTKPTNNADHNTVCKGLDSYVNLALFLDRAL